MVTRLEMNIQGVYTCERSRTISKLRAKDRPLANDFVSDEDFDRMLHDWFGNMARVLLPGHSYYGPLRP